MADDKKKKDPGKKPPEGEPVSAPVRYKMLLPMRCGAMAFPKGKVVTAAFLKSRGVDIAGHLEKKLIEEVK